MPLISICIPAYRQPAFLQRCLQSIADQRCHDVEIIITDDSPGAELQAVANPFSAMFSIAYHHNATPLGSPANWTAALAKATGAYVMLLHHDDWLHRADTLDLLVDALEANPTADAAFAAYKYVDQESNSERQIVLNMEMWQKLQKAPELLFASNLIGPPSVLLMRRQNLVTYDPALKWLVDLEGYYRYLKAGHQLVYVPQCLVSIGESNHQVTATAKYNPQVQVYEHLYCLQKHGTPILRRWQTYDAYWRMLRNAGVRSEAQLNEFAAPLHPSAIVAYMVNWQRHIPPFILKIGLYSKQFMFLSYLNALRQKAFWNN
jgi:glycosyltransferase involved in cell wall biosynthesis